MCVRGYTRANGTYVQGYVRSAPGRNTNSSPRVSASGNGGTVQVSGYTRRDGTQVSGYTRSTPQPRNSSCSSNSQGPRTGSGQGHTVQVSDYTRADGTRVSGYTRSMPGSSNRSQSSSNSGSGIGSSHGRTVQVSGYTRRDGTQVSGYTRSMPGSSNSSQQWGSTDRQSSANSGQTVQAGGYTRPQAPGYTRSTPGLQLSHNTSTLSRNSGAESGRTVQTSTYTQSDGTQISGYTDGLLSMARRGVNWLRGAFPVSFPSFSRYRNPTPASSSNSEASNSDSEDESGRTDQVSPYTSSDHTQASTGVTVPTAPTAPGLNSRSRDGVESGRTDEASALTGSAQGADYARSMPGPLSNSGRSCNDNNTATSGLRYYVNNAYNRRLGRVGQPLGSCVVHSSLTPGTHTGGDREATQRCYVDNPHNRRLRRVGKPIPQKRVRQQELLEENTIQDLIEIMQCLAFTDSIRPDYQYVVDRLEREEIEETWRARRVNPSTEISFLAHHYLGTVIPSDELQLERRVIGRGRFGKVYAGMWHGTPVAFKKLHYQHMSRERQESYVTEIAVLAAIDHDNTVKMFGAVLQRGNIGIVMEYLPRSLSQAIFVDCTDFSESKKKEIVSQIASAIQYLHTHESIIAHCDVKSENVLLDKNNDAKLGDFGLSAMKSTVEGSQSSTAGTVPGRGTPCYSAPEVLRGERLTVDQLLPTDVYSLSIVVFEVLVEEEPFQGLSVQQLEAHVGYGDLRPTSSVNFSQPVARLLKSCWDACPSSRPTSTEFLVDWSDISVLYES